MNELEPTQEKSNMFDILGITHRFTRKPKFKHSKEQAEQDGFIESIIPNTWFRKDSEHLFSVTPDGLVKRCGNKDSLPKDENGNILTYREINNLNESNMEENLEIKLFAEYLLKCNKELKYILIIAENKNSENIKLLIEERALIVDKDISSDEVIADYTQGNHFGDQLSIIKYKVYPVKNMKIIYQIADAIFKKYTELSQENFDDKLDNYKKAANYCNETLLSIINRYPSISI